MKLMKFVLPAGILVAGYLVMKGIEVSAADVEADAPIDTRPTVTVLSLTPETIAVTLSSYGEVSPLESTNLAAQVAGEVESWNPNFVAGGIVRRGDVLFTIEKDAYEAALLLAEANLSSAKAQLIQEEAQAEVARLEAKTMPDARVTDLYLRKPQVMSAQAAVKSAEAQLKIAARDLDNCEVRAPYDALIVSRDISKGDYVTQGMKTAVINNVEFAEVTFPVAGFDRQFVGADIIGSSATLELDAPLKTHITATIHRDTGIIDSTTRMTHFVARIDDPYALNGDKTVVKFGSYGTVVFKGKALENVYRIPQTLITSRKIWTLDEDNNLVAQPVEVIREDGTDFLIRGNFNAKSVVMSLPEYPQEGMPVKVIASNDQLLVSHHVEK
ncbi:efflux RND transporter periplasmic adaptor subunit [Alteromonas australica]|uniref:Membrane protein n=1 Tax=Alteromonas australica TaxID=589873 RepID=A0A075NUX6_9ALTE|nr:efflux RND transporter periplasmic adaptor subunit [Alteromonas australica]AIF98444.1 membrane protein [Alteromonas australica]